jgi:hypothetical protein
MEGGPRRLCLTAPWMENGNVVDFIKQYPNTDGILLVSLAEFFFGLLRSDFIMHLLDARHCSGSGISSQFTAEYHPR